MTEQEKKIMMIDLCARLSHGVKGMVKTTDGNGQEITDDGVINSVFIDEYCNAYICIEGAEYELEDVKPYIRPILTMTEEEFWELKELGVSLPSTFKEYYGQMQYHSNGAEWAVIDVEIEDIVKYVNYLYAHHFDVPHWIESEKKYKSMIEMGLALPAPNEMYNIK